MTLLEHIQQLDDFKALRLYEHVSNMLFNATEANAETLMQHMPVSFAFTEELKQNYASG